MTLADLLGDRASDSPNLGYTWLDDDLNETQNLSFCQLNDRAKAIAKKLQEKRLAGERAALLFPPGLEFISALFGCFYASVIAVPAYAIRSRRDWRRLATIIRDARPAAVLTTSRYIRTTENILSAGSMRGIICTAIDELVSDGSWRAPTDITEDQLGYLQYTSGSTSSPRGVMISHSNVLSNLAYIAENGGFTEKSRSVSWLPHFHDMGLVYGILQPLYSRFSAILMSPASFARRPASWLEAITRYRGTHCGGPNFAYQLCLQRTDRETLKRLNLESWTVAFNGAEPVEFSTMDSFSEYFQPCGFERKAFYPVYGLAEATLKVSGPNPGAAITKRIVSKEALGNHAIELSAVDDSTGRILVGCGRTNSSTRVVIVDPETREQRDGTIGEIWVSGPGVARGYWRRPQETAEVFGARLKSGEGPFLRTGDLGFMADGELFITGRLKDCVIIRGKNYYPQDIERSIVRSHAALNSGSAVAFSVRARDNEQLMVVAEVHSSDLQLSDEIMRAIREAVSLEHALQVFGVVLAPVGTLPRTTSGKLQRQACRSAFLNGTLKISQCSIIESFADNNKKGRLDLEALQRCSPDERVNLVREYLLDIIAEALRSDLVEFQTDGSLAAFGFDSLMALELSFRIEAELGIKASLEMILGEANLNDLTASILSQFQHKEDAKDNIHSRLSYPTVENFPLSFNQEGLWLIHRLAPASSAYNLFRAFKISAGLNLEALLRALQGLIDRHGALRARIGDTSGSPYQWILPQMEVPFEFVDGSSWSESDLEERLSDFANKPFDFHEGSLCHFWLISRPEAENVLLMAVHHIVCDFWSFGILIRDFIALYEAESKGRIAKLSSATATLDQYVRWQRESLTPQKESQLYAYWKSQLAGWVTELSIGSGQTTRKADGRAKQTSLFRIDRETSAQLKEIAAGSSATLHATVLTTLATLLYRHTSQPKILIGAASHGRTESAFRDLVGYLVSPLIIQADLSGSPQFRSLQASIGTAVMEAIQRRGLPFSSLAQLIDSRETSQQSATLRVMLYFLQPHIRDHASLMPLLFGLPGATVELGGLTAESLQVLRHSAQFDLTLTVAEINSELVGVFEYDSGVIDSEIAERLPYRFEALIEGVVANPSQKIDLLPVLNEDERRRQLILWNLTRKNLPEQLLLHELFETQVERTPDAIALQFEGLGVSYRELDHKASQVAEWLQARGVEPEMIVGLCADRSPETLAGIIGILKAGGVYLPLDPKDPPRRLQSVLEQAKPAVILCQSQRLNALANWPSQVIDLNELFWSQPDRSVHCSADFADHHLAYVIYTSGSTGAPKGAMNTHRAICNRLLWLQREHPVGQLDCGLHKTPLTFDVSITEVFETLITGGKLVIARPDGHRDIGYIRKLIEAEQVTIVHFVPSMLHAFLEDGGMSRCHSVQSVMCTGEAVTIELQNKFFDRSEARLLNLYGPTEAAVEVTAWSCDRDQKSGMVPIGRPIDNIQTYVLGQELQPTPVNCQGELLLGGDGLARGYLRSPGATATSFIPNPFSGLRGDRLYRTGDFVYQRPDGFLVFVGRVDAQVKIRGVRVELSEIESALNLHHSVSCSAVCYEGSAGERNLSAFIVPSDWTDWNLRALREFLAERLPSTFIPTRFARLRQLPSLSNGKIDRKALRNLDCEWETFDRAPSIPSTPTEQLVAEIYSEMLNTNPVDTRLNFFELGGHSLLATRLLSRLRDVFQLELPLEMMFAGDASVVSVAAMIDEMLKGGTEQRAEV